MITTKRKIDNKPYFDLAPTKVATEETIAIEKNGENVDGATQLILVTDYIDSKGCITKLR